MPGSKTFPGFVKFLIESLGEGGGQIAFETYVAGAGVNETRNLVDELSKAGVTISAPRTQAEVDRQAVLDKKASEAGAVAETVAEESKS